MENNILHKDHKMIYEHKMVDGERALVLRLASSLNVHVHSSKSAGFFDVHAKSGSVRYAMWESFTHTFYPDHARSWDEAIGDFW
jgi:hypothetical protein